MARTTGEDVPMDDSIVPGENAEYIPCNVLSTESVKAIFKYIREFIKKKKCYIVRL